jgi:hypothetical protein
MGEKIEEGKERQPLDWDKVAEILDSQIEILQKMERDARWRENKLEVQKLLLAYLRLAVIFLSAAPAPTSDDMKQMLERLGIFVSSHRELLG